MLELMELYFLTINHLKGNYGKVIRQIAQKSFIRLPRQNNTKNDQTLCDYCVFARNYEIHSILYVSGDF